MRQPLGIVQVLVSGEPPEDRRANQGGERVAAILPGPSVGENLSRSVLFRVRSRINLSTLIRSPGA